MNVGFDVLVASRTALPLVELAQAFASALDETGHDARIVDDRIPAATGPRSSSAHTMSTRTSRRRIQPG
jgi:hypothetical protein